MSGRFDLGENEEYEDFIHHLADREYFGQKLGLERIQKLLERLGNPQDQFPSIHIAGTNGKGSTAAMIASIVQSAGYRTGLYTSPHLNDFCERIRIGDDLIAQDQVMLCVRTIREVEEEPLTFFELATAIAFLHFAESKVDIAVVETGLGGRLDATNIVKPLVSVITTIGFDHRQHLGDTIEAIAREKAGIIKEGVPVVVGNLSEEAMNVIQDVAHQKHAPVLRAGIVSVPARVNLSLAGDHQQENTAIAVSAVHAVSESFPQVTEEAAIRKGLDSVRWPGRLETICDEPWILLDGAHNLQAMISLRKFLESHLKGRRLWLLFGAMKDKEIEALLSEILPTADSVVVTAPNMKRAAEPQALAELVGSLGGTAQIKPTVDEALPWILKNIQKDEILVITGSLFLVGEARTWFEQKLVDF